MAKKDRKWGVTFFTIRCCPYLNVIFFYNFFLRDLITGFYSANYLTLFVLEFISSIRRLTQRRNALIIGRTGMKRQIFEIKE